MLKSGKGITKADLTTQASEKLIQQDFTAKSPNEKWLITCPQRFSSKIFTTGVKKFQAHGMIFH